MSNVHFTLSVFAMGLLLMSCKNDGPHDEDDGSVMSEINTQLPVASHASMSPCSACHRVFLTLEKDGYHLDDHAKISDLTALEEALAHAHHQATAGHLPLLYLISPPDLAFARTSIAIRAAAKAGFADIFLVAKRQTTSGNHLKHGLLLQLPVADGTPPPAIAPVFIKADAKGQIFINTGPSQELLDEGIYLRHFPKLQERLDAYCALARAGDHAPHAQVYVESRAPHQRAIDILNTLHAVGIKNITFTTLTGEPQRTCQGMGKGKPGTTTQSPSAIPRPPATPNPIHRWSP